MSKENIFLCIPVRMTEENGRSRSTVSMAYLDTDYVYRKDAEGVSRKEEKWSWRGKKKPSELEEKKMLMFMVVILVRLILENHLYQLSGSLYRQDSGAPI